MATAPFEIIAAPFDVYVAPVGTAFPDISATPSASWFLLGSSGNKNYDEDGVTITHEQEVEEWVPAGLTAARKAFRTTESLVIAFNVADVSAAQYAKILNGATVTDTAAGSGTGGNLNFPLLQGMSVSIFALLCRSGESAAGNLFNSSYEVPIAYQAANPEPQYKKGTPAMLACEWRALWDSATGFGRYRSQDAAAL